MWFVLQAAYSLLHEKKKDKKRQKKRKEKKAPAEKTNVFFLNNIVL